DVDAGGEVELHQRVHGLRSRIDDVQEALVRAHLELFAALLVDVRRAVHRKFLDPGRQRNRTTDLGASALGRVDDLARRRIEDAVIERLQPDPDILAVHLSFLSRLSSSAKADDPVIGRPSVHPQNRGILGPPLSAGGDSTLAYSMMLATTPAPTVRPPSRIAKRSFSSMAIGTIRCTSIATLSPGITISVPCGRCTTPVTSVVRK